MRTVGVSFAVAVIGSLVLSSGPRAQTDDASVLAWAQEVNRNLAADGRDIAIAEIEAYTVGRGRSVTRVLQEFLRWVPNDPRRRPFSPADDDITYLFDLSDGTPSTGPGPLATDAAVGGASATWDAALSSVDVVRMPDPGADPDFVDGLVGCGPLGFPFFADIVHGGFLPTFPCIAAIFGPADAPNVVAFTVLFVFTNSDINGDQYSDTALAEIYYNDDFIWGINADLPAGFDVETAALHETGHALGLGHFGPPPSALMNPVYSGLQQFLSPIDRAGARTVYASWPAR